MPEAPTHTRDIATLVRTRLRATFDLGDQPLPDNTELEALPGADSVRVMRVLTALEDDLNVRCDDTAARRMTTVGDLIHLISTAPPA